MNKNVDKLDKVLKPYNFNYRGSLEKLEEIFRTLVSSKYDINVRFYWNNGHNYTVEYRVYYQGNKIPIFMWAIGRVNYTDFYGIKGNPFRISGYKQILEPVEEKVREYLYSKYKIGELS